MSGWEMMKAGGPIMAPILLCSLLSLIIVIEKLWYLASLNGNTQKLKKEVFEDVKNNNLKEAITKCENAPSPVAKILKSGILKFGSSPEEIKEAMEDVSLYEIPKLENRMGALATIAHIAPLLGLLGTVTGMTGSFYMIQMKANSMNPLTPGDLAGGIWEALITTIAGLMVAIPSYVLYNYYLARINTIILDMERAATELVNFLSQLTEKQTAENFKKEDIPLEI